ncbi:MAG: DUF5615 family PIN-like protein [Phycisphaerae bacterium]
MADYAPGTDDVEVLGLANAQQRIVLTFDGDFGDLIFRRGCSAPGVVLLRLRTRSASELLSVFAEVWPTVEPRAPGAFIVVSHAGVRVRPL